VTALAYTRAQESDIAGVQQAAVASWHATYAKIFSAEIIATYLQEGYSTDALRQAFRITDSTFLVTKDAGQIVGYAQ
jgi:hypothetical protein